LGAGNGLVTSTSQIAVSASSFTEVVDMVIKHNSVYLSLKIADTDKGITGRFNIDGTKLWSF